MQLKEIEQQAELLQEQWKNGNTTHVAKAIMHSAPLAVAVTRLIGQSDARILAHKVLDNLAKEPQPERVVMELTHAEMEAQLKKEGNVWFLWSIEDVQSRRSDLSNEQAMQVLEHCKATHDCNYGMTWEHIDQAAESLFGEAPEETEEAEVEGDDVLNNPGTSQD